MFFEKRPPDGFGVRSALLFARKDNGRGYGETSLGYALFAETISVSIGLEVNERSNSRGVLVMYAEHSVSAVENRTTNASSKRAGKPAALAKFEFASRMFDAGSAFGRMWTLESTLLPPGINQMYSTGSSPSGKSMMFHSSEAKRWKSMFADIVARAGNGLGEGPCCAGLYLFVPANFDTDNRLKMLNDAVQGTVVSNDKVFHRSVQYKTNAGARADKRFLYVAAPMDGFSKLIELFDSISSTFDTNGELKRELRGLVGNRLDELMESFGARLRARSV